MTNIRYDQREDENGQISKTIFQKPLTNLEAEETFTETIAKKVKGLVITITNGGPIGLKTIGKFLLSEKVQ